MANWNQAGCSFRWMLAKEHSSAIFLAFASPGLTKFSEQRNTARLPWPCWEQTDPHTILHIYAQTCTCTVADKAKKTWCKRQVSISEEPTVLGFVANTLVASVVCPGTIPGQKRPILGIEGQSALRYITTVLERLFASPASAWFTLG